MENKTGNTPQEDYKTVGTMRETDRKCPRCGGIMDFSPETGGLFCPFCEYKEEIENSESATENDFLSAEENGNYDWGTQKKNVVCQSCGANIIYDELAISSECPYCGSNHVMEAAGGNEKTLAPGGIVPFRITAKEASVKFIAWIKRKIFCPSAAKRNAKPDAVKGVYLPYWTFDTDTTSSYTGRYGKDRTVRDAKGNSRIVTDWHSTSGIYSQFIDDQLVCGTTRYDNSMLRRIEPFDTASNKVYLPEFVAGFPSERYSLGLKDSWEKAKEFIADRLKSNISSDIKARYHADRVASLNILTNYRNIKYKYLLLPIWFSSYKYNGKIFFFMVNGQTGKVGGKTPISAIRVMIAILLALAVVIILYMLYSRT